MFLFLRGACHGLYDVDRQLLRAARTRGHDPRAERAVAAFSRLGEHAALWLALGGAGSVLAGPNRRAGWRRATAVVAGTYAANTTLKLLVRRRRPELPGLPPLTSTPTRLSFPSAHASTAFAGARAYSRLGLPGAPLYALAASLALSRLYLGVHHPSDVLGGALLGTAIAVAAQAPVDAGQEAPRPHAPHAADPRGRSPMKPPS